MTEIRIKRGAAFRAPLTFTDDFGVPIDLTTVTLASQLRTATDDLVATLPITVTNQAGVATIQVADTTLWPIGLLHGDIKMVTGGLPVLSETFAVRVNRQSTV